MPLLVGISHPSESPQSGPFGEAAAAATVADQQQFVTEVVPTLLSRANVHGIAWNCFTDQHAPDLLGCGLLDSQGNAKPALAELTRLRQRYLH